MKNKEIKRWIKTKEVNEEKLKKTKEVKEGKTQKNNKKVKSQFPPSNIDDYDIPQIKVVEEDDYDIDILSSW